MKFIKFIILSALFFSFLLSEAQIALGQWRSHFPYIRSKALTISNNKVYIATAVSLYSYDLNEFSIERISKINGLSDAGFSTIKYSHDNDLLLIAYSNANVDLIRNNEIINISDIKLKPILGNKNINDILFLGEYAYLSCGFGIVVINLAKNEIADTYYIGENGENVNVMDLAYDETHFYAATETGIYRADASATNLSDYNNWERIENIPNYNSNFNTVCLFDGYLVMNYDDAEAGKDTLYKYMPANNSWEYFADEIHYTNKLEVSGNKLVVSEHNAVIVFDKQLNAETITWWGLSPANAIYDERGNLWIACKGLSLYKKDTYGTIHTILPNGPSHKYAYDMTVSNNKLWTVAGARDPVWNNLFYRVTLNSFDNKKWKKINSDIPELETKRDFVSVVAHPDDPERIFAASWGGGLVEFQNSEFVALYNETNSSLQNMIGQTAGQYVRIQGLAFDSENNLWITNSGVSKPISVMKTDGTWENFPYNAAMNNIDLVGDIIVTDNNHKWVVLPRGTGLFAFENQSQETAPGAGTIWVGDDITKKFSVRDENGSLINNNIYAIAEDLNGVIWLGTTAGIVVYYNAGNVFTGQNFYAQQIITQESGTAQYLLHSEVVTSIAIDGANQKWLGTEKAGVFLMSEDGTEQIEHFNTENSPLPSNNILSISINHQTGEVYFATEGGLISYKAKTTQGYSTYYNVYAFPNPVREDYYGDIAIRGLKTSANVKITDVSGNLVYETTAKGGQATWNGKNFDGNRAATGVYIVFCSNDDGTDTLVTKILFVN